MNDKNKHIILLGFMGCGKSTIGDLLVSSLPAYSFVDLDTVIETKEKSSISKIFATKGESHFRRLESIHLKNLISNTNKKYIISLGGGTPCYFGNMELVKDHISIYLKVGVERLVHRLSIEAENRPLIADLAKPELRHFIKSSLYYRKTFYEKASIHVMAHRSPDQIVNLILRKLNL